MVASNNEREVYLPHIGVWNKTQPGNMPPAGSTHLGLWLDKHTSRVGFCCVFFCDNDGNGVDPDEEEWDHFTFHSRQWDAAIESDEALPPPDYWAECRFVIPGN